jgi:hypothetical protein
VLQQKAAPICVAWCSLVHERCQSRARFLSFSAPQDGSPLFLTQLFVQGVAVRPNRVEGQQVVTGWSFGLFEFPGLSHPRSVRSGCCCHPQFPVAYPALHPVLLLVPIQDRPLYLPLFHFHLRPLCLTLLRPRLPSSTPTSCSFNPHSLEHPFPTLCPSHPQYTRTHTLGHLGIPTTSYLHVSAIVIDYDTRSFPRSPWRLKGGRAGKLLPATTRLQDLLQL